MQKTYLFFTLLFLKFQTVLATSSVGIDPELKKELQFLPDVSLQQPGASAEDKVYSFAGDIIITILQFGGGLAVLFIVKKTKKMLLAAGEEEKVIEARRGIVWALTGLILIILSYTIIQFVVKIGLFVEEVN